MTQAVAYTTVRFHLHIDYAQLSRMCTLARSDGKLDACAPRACLHICCCANQR